MDYYEEIKNKIIDNETYEKVKDYSKERHRVITYFEIGKLLNEAGGKYGDNIINEYSKKLVIEVGKKYNRRTLFRMRQFYRTFSNEKVSPLVTQLTWTHYLVLLSVKDSNAVNYYIDQIFKRNLSKRQLQEVIKSKEYERLPNETKNKIIKEEKLEVKDLVPNPILIKNKNNIEIITEKVLHNLILEDILSFMKELGRTMPEELRTPDKSLKEIERDNFKIRLNNYLFIIITTKKLILNLTITKKKTYLFE